MHISDNIFNILFSRCRRSRHFGRFEQGETSFPRTFQPKLRHLRKHDWKFGTGKTRHFGFSNCTGVSVSEWFRYRDLISKQILSERLDTKTPPPPSVSLFRIPRPQCTVSQFLIKIYSTYHGFWQAKLGYGF